MARGPKKHLKRLNAPRHWMLSKLGGEWAPRPSTGPHKLRECLPLCLILRNRLKYALTGREVMMILMRRLVEVDGKVRTDVNYPAGFMDVVSIAATKEKFRLMYDVKGRFYLQKVDANRAKWKLLKVVKKGKGKKASIGRNPFIVGVPEGPKKKFKDMTAEEKAREKSRQKRDASQVGQAQAIPYIVTHDGRTIRYADPAIKIGDTIKYEYKTNKITDIIPFQTGNICMVTKGANTGRVGIMMRIEKHPGAFDIVYLKDKSGAEFATRQGNVFCIGKGEKEMIKLPRVKGIKKSIIEERQMRLNKQADK